MKYSIFDAHVDTLLAIKNTIEFIDGNNRTHLDLPRAVNAGVTHLVTAICTESSKTKKQSREKWLRGIANYRELKNVTEPELLLMVEGCRELLYSHKQAEIIEMMTFASLTWNGENKLAGGIGSDAGLSEAGRAFALKLNDKGVIIDVSHLSDRSRKGIFELDIPLVATHCNCRALMDVPRNLPDDDIKEIADRGGVIGILFFDKFLGKDANIDTIIDHVEHIVDIAGLEHVGFGSDFDGISYLPEGVEGCSAWHSITDRMATRGWHTKEIQAVTSANWLRVVKQNTGTGS